MNLTIGSDWKKVLRYAWSVRFMILAAILSGLEVALPYLPVMMSGGVFAMLSMFMTAAAFIARFVAQKEFDDEPDQQDPADDK